MELMDMTMNCKDCGKDFIFTTGEQAFYKEKGFENQPSRCPTCRTAKKRERGGGARKLYDVNCAECNAPAKVPFQPRQGRPVLCRNCFEKGKA